MIQRLDIAVDGLLHGPDIADDSLRCDIFGVNDAAQIQTVDHIPEGDAVDLGDGLCLGHPAGIQGQQNIFLIDAGEGHHRLGPLDALLPQQLLVGAVAVDDDRFWQQNGQLLAPLPLDLDDLHINAHAQKLLCQIIRGLSPADKHGVAHPVGLEADVLQKLFAHRAGGGKGQDIPRPDDIIAPGNGDLPVPLGGTDQDIGRDALAQRDQVHAVQHIALRHLELDQIGLSVGEGVDLQRGGQVEDAGDLCRRLHLRIDDHGQAQLFPQIAGLLAVIGGAHPGDGGAVAHLLGHGAAQQIQLVRFGDGDEQIGLFQPGLLQNAVAGAVAHDAHDVIGAGHIPHQLGVAIHYDDIVALLGQLLHQRAAHLSAAHDDDLQAAAFLFLSSQHIVHSVFTTGRGRGRPFRRRYPPLSPL